MHILLLLLSPLLIFPLTSLSLSYFLSNTQTNSPPFSNARSLINLTHGNLNFIRHRRTWTAMLSSANPRRASRQMRAILDRFTTHNLLYHPLPTIHKCNTGQVHYPQSTLHYPPFTT